MKRPCALVLALALTVATQARAQTDPVVAQALFDEAKLLIKKGDWAAACPKLAESERLDPGVGTLLNLGECYDHIGKTARAWATFREAEAVAVQQGQQARAQYAKGRALLLESSLVRVTIEVPEAARVPGLRVTRDREVVNEPLWGSAVPVDPGEHVIEARAPGYKTFSARIVAARDPIVVRLDPLEAEPPAPTPPPPVEVPPPLPPPEPVLVAKPVERVGTVGTPVDGGPMRTSGYVLGAVGLAGVGLGSLFGVFAIDKDNASRAAGCSSTTCPTQGGVDLTHQAITFATAANVTFLVSTVLLVTGVAFVIVAPRSAPARAAQALLRPWSFP